MCDLMIHDEDRHEHGGDEMILEIRDLGQHNEYGHLNIDRYTVIFDEPEQPGYALAMNGRPFHPQGFCQHTTAEAGDHLGERIDFDDLPDDCKTVVRRELRAIHDAYEAEYGE